MRESDDPKYGTKEGASKEDFMVEVRARYQAACDYWDPIFKRCLEDVKFAFVPDCQWDDWMIRSRVGRPSYTVNKLRQAIKQITNDQRMNRPQPKVRAVEDSDADLAEIRQGLFRNIEQQSTADTAYDGAFLFGVAGGYGNWRITTQYADEGSFDQDIRIKAISNPFTVRMDPSAREPDRRDAGYCFVDQRMTRQAFKAKYPKAECRDLVGLSSSEIAWWGEKDVLLSEYWYVTTEEKSISLLSDGRVVDTASLADIADELLLAGVTIEKERTVDVKRVKQCIVSGAEVLESTDWAGKFIPIVIVWGNLLNIDGKEEIHGEVRHNKDAARMYNYERSTFIEVLADQPYSPFMAAAASIEGHEKAYQSMRTEKAPVLLYNADPLLPNSGMPTRIPPPAFPASLANAAQISADDIKSGTGIYDASLGARSNETSGRAILARQKEGDVSSFDYADNLARAHKFSYEIINDLIPHILDTERQIRVIGDDGAEKVIAVNKPVWDDEQGKWVTVNDLAQGRFDVAVTVGPSFTTQRMETAEAMMQFAQDPSPLGMLAKYAAIKALDLPGMDDVRTGMRDFLVKQGLLKPEEDQQPDPPPPPNPKDVADAELKKAQAVKAEADAKRALADAEQTTTETQRMVAMDQVALGPSPIPTDVPGMPAVPPPMPMQPMQPDQPPNGGFLMS